MAQDESDLKASFLLCSFPDSRKYCEYFPWKEAINISTHCNNHEQLQLPTWQDVYKGTSGTHMLLALKDLKPTQQEVNYA